MRRRLMGLLLAGVILGSAVAEAAGPQNWSSLIVCDGPGADALRATLVKALRLLPRLPARVAVIDASEAKPDVQSTLLRLDAFVTRGSAVVYVVKQSRLLRGALDGSALHTHALAAVIWHEMSHAEGGDERQARKQEEALWTSFIRDGLVDNVAALRYLRALTERPDDHVLAAR